MLEALRRIYEKPAAKQPVYELIRRFGAPPDVLRKRLHFEGGLQARGAARPFKMTNVSCELETALFWRGLESAWEPVSMSLWRRACCHAHTILDVGANTGLYALVAKAETPPPRSSRDLGPTVDEGRLPVAYYEAQSDRPPAHVLDRLAAVLGVSADQLLGRRQPAGDVQIPFDVRIWRRLRIVEKLPPADRNAVIKCAEALAKDSPLKTDPDDRRKAS